MNTRTTARTQEFAKSQEIPALAVGATLIRRGMLPITVVSQDADYGFLCEDTVGRTAFLPATFFRGWMALA